MGSSAEDLSLILWDLSSGAQLKSMTGHTSSINSLSFSSESTVLASGSSDGTVRVWDVIYLPPSASSSTALLTKTGGSKSGRKHLERSEMRLAEKMRKGSEMALAKGGLGAGGSIGGGAGDNKAVAMMGLLPKSSITEKEIAPRSAARFSFASLFLRFRWRTDASISLLLAVRICFARLPRSEHLFSTSISRLAIFVSLQDRCSKVDFDLVGTECNREKKNSKFTSNPQRTTTIDTTTTHQRRSDCPVGKANFSEMKEEGEKKGNEKKLTTQIRKEEEGSLNKLEQQKIRGGY